VGDTRARRVDVRVVSATHRCLEQAVHGGVFRADLYFRLNAVRVRLPALRERGEDVVLLARHFLAAAAARLGREAPEPGPELLAHLRGYAWPGNVRELANGCAFAVHVADARERVDLEHWPETPLPCAPGGGTAAGLHAETRALEERRLREALERTRGNKSQAARALGLSRQGLLKKLRRYGLTPAESATLGLDAAGGAP
jgi:DNA-binding NtrC family response regulator